MRPSIISMLLIAALTTAACSGAPDSSPSSSPAAPDAAAALAQAKANAKVQTSVHLKGMGMCPDGPFAVDVTVRDDEAAAGTIKVGSDTLNIVADRQTLLIQAPSAFWAAQSSATTAKAIANRWVRVPRSTNPCFSALTSLSTALDNYLGYPGEPTVVAQKPFEGRDAVLVGINTDVSIWLAAKGTPLPLNVHDVGTGTDITFDKWSEKFTPVVPPAFQVVAAAQLPR